MRLTSRLVSAVALLAVAGVVGCGGEQAYPVTGTVTFEGKPIQGGGSITFMPVGESGKAAGGEIAADGTYTLTTTEPGDGTLAGEYRVIILQVTEQEGKVIPKDGEEPIPGGGNVVPQKDRIPMLYGDPYNAPLTATVEPKENTINFDLKRNAAGNSGAPGWGA